MTGFVMLFPVLAIQKTFFDVLAVYSSSVISYKAFGQVCVVSDVVLLLGKAVYVENLSITDKFFYHTCYILIILLLNTIYIFPMLRRLDLALSKTFPRILLIDCSSHEYMVVIQYCLLHHYKFFAASNSGFNTEVQKNSLIGDFTTQNHRTH